MKRVKVMGEERSITMLTVGDWKKLREKGAGFDKWTDDEIKDKSDLAFVIGQYILDKGSPPVSVDDLTMPELYSVIRAATIEGEIDRPT